MRKTNGILPSFCCTAMKMCWLFGKMSVIQRMKKNISQEQNVWDQGVVNEMLDGEYSWLKCGYFDDKIWIGG